MKRARAVTSRTTLLVVVTTVAAAIVLISAGIATLQLRHASSSLVHTHVEDLVRTEATRSLSTEYAAALRGYLLAGDAALRGELVAAQEQLSTHVRLHRTAGTARVRSDQLALIAAADNLLAGLDSGSLTLEAARDRWRRRLAPAQSRLQHLLDAHLQAERAALRKAVRELERDSRTIFSWLLLASISALVLSTGVAVVAARGIAAAFQQREDALVREQASRAAAEAAAANLENVGNFRERFLGIIAHDLRGPLNVISMSAEHLMRQPDPDRLKRVTERVYKSARRMDALLAELLDFTRVRLGDGIPVVREPADLVEICRDCVEETRALAPVQLNTNAAFITGLWDPRRLAQALANLLTNAAKHGAAGAPISVEIEQKELKAVIKVHNEGEPIPQQILTSIFDPFKQATSKRGGTGLGLYIAREVARAHGGDITVASDAEHGTAFTLELPIYAHPPAHPS